MITLTKKKKSEVAGQSIRMPFTAVQVQKDGIPCIIREGVMLLLCSNCTRWKEREFVTRTVVAVNSTLTSVKWCFRIF